MTKAELMKLATLYADSVFSKAQAEYETAIRDLSAAQLDQIMREKDA